LPGGLPRGEAPDVHEGNSPWPWTSTPERNAVVDDLEFLGLVRRRPHPPTGGNVSPLALLHGVPVRALGGSGYLPAPVADPGGHIGESA
jgi:hypothetical protein